MKLYLLFFLPILISCSTSKPIIQTGIKEINFGTGGGFTGEVKTYVLTTESKLLEKGKELKKVKSETTLSLYNKALVVKDYSFNEPDNIYMFIEIKTNEKTNRIVWHVGSKIDDKIIELYNNLISITK